MLLKTKNAFNNLCRIFNNTKITLSTSKVAIVRSFSVNKGLEGLKSDSRRGSLIPGGSRRGSLIPGRSRQGSIALGGPDRATVAMITDDPENKKNLKVALAGAFEDSAISKYILL